MTTETKLEERVRKLELDGVEDRTLMKQHIVSCDNRNGLILKLVLWAFLGILILVIENTFNIHVPSNIPAIP